MNSKVYINEKQLELLPNTVIATTFQMYDLGELKDFQVNHTNTIKVPRTPANKIALGFADEITSSERIPYKVNGVRIFSSGVEITPNGVGIFSQIGEFYELVVYSGLFDLFETLNGLTLHDIPTLPSYDHVWNRVNASNSAANSTGYIYPALQYGTNGTSDNYIYVRQAFPSFFIHTLVSDLLTAQGFTKSGSILSDSFYQSWALPFSQSKYRHSDRYVSERGFSNQLGQTYVMGDTYNSTINNRVGALLTLQPNQAFTSPGSSTIDCTIKASIIDFSKGLQSGDSIDVKLGIWKNSGTTPVLLASTSITADGDYSVTLAGITLTNGETLEAAILADYTVTSGIYNAYGLKVTACSMYSAPIERDVVFENTVTPESYLPKLNQKTFLKAIGNQLGLIFKVDPAEKKIEFRELSEIPKNIYKAVDWSDKLVKPKSSDPSQWYVSKKTVLSNQYGQKSYLRYKDDETVPSELGDAYLTVNNEVLEQSKDLFTLPWAASDSEVLMLHDEYIASIPFWEDDGAGGYQETKEKPKQRIVYIDRADKTLDYNDGTTTVSVATNCPFAKFKDPTELNNLDMVSLKAKQYSEFQDVLTDAVRLVVLLNLDVTDIVNFDHFIPVYIDRFNGYFYVNKIKDFIQGEISTVDLIKIG